MGKQYDDDTADAKKVLADLATHYPDATNYEVAGFFFWQGEKDGGNPAHAAKYEENLVRFIKRLRQDFDAPDAKFVLATLGEATKGSGGNGGRILEAQLAVDGTTGKYPEFKGNVATVYANPLSMGGSGNSHYNGHAETYMNVGEAMGKAMVELLKGAKKSTATRTPHRESNAMKPVAVAGSLTACGVSSPNGIIPVANDRRASGIPGGDPR